MRTSVERRRQILGATPGEGDRAEGHQHGKRDKLEDASRDVDFLDTFEKVLKFSLGRIIMLKQ